MATLYGFFPGQGRRSEFQNWTGKPAATVVNFVNVFGSGITPSGYLSGTIAPIWESGGVPMLTLEPADQGNTVEADTANGDYDATWQAWADAVADYITSHSPNAKIYIRLAHEMNGNWYEWSQNPSAYVDMWRHVYDIFTSTSGINRSQCQFVWCVNGDDVPSDNDAEAYYPGDSYVDWVGIDGYNFGSTDPTGWRSPSTIFDGMLGRMRSLTNKPITIPETASTSMKGGAVDTAAKGQWIHDLFDYVNANAIKNVNWFNQDKETDWPVFDGPRGTATADVGGTTFDVYEGYKSEVVRDRVYGSAGDELLSPGQFSGGDITNVDTVEQDNSPDTGDDTGTDTGGGQPFESSGLGLMVRGGGFSGLSSGNSTDDESGGGGGGGGGSDPIGDGDGNSGGPGGDGTGVGSPGFGDNTTTTKYAVADLGWDNTGGTTITEGEIDSALADNVKLKFEPGTYQIDPNGGTGAVLSGYSNIAWLGDGATRDEVRFKLPDGASGRIWNFAGSCDNVWWGNFVVDQSASRSYAEMNYTADGDLYAYNFATRGGAADENSAGPPGDPFESTSCLTFAMGSSATAHVEDFETISPPEKVVDYPDNGAGIYAGFGNKGDIDLVNARIENQGEHAAYCSRTPGNVRVDGGLFRNNLNTNMRLCGSGSYIRNATIVIDPPQGFNIETDTGDEKSMRGLRWEDGSDAGSEGQTGGYVRNVDFIKTKSIDAAASLIEIDGNAGAMSIEQCRFRDESSDYNDVIYIEEIGDGPQGQVPPTPHDVTVTFCSFTGSGDNAAVRSERSSAPTHVTNCCLGMAGGPGFTGAIDESGTSTSGCERAQV